MENSNFNQWIDAQIVMHSLHISQRTLARLRTRGIIPFSKIGKKIYYNRLDIENLLLANYSKHQSEQNIRNNQPNTPSLKHHL
jgi:hypothetical protein